MEGRQRPISDLDCMSHDGQIFEEEFKGIVTNANLFLLKFFTISGVLRRTL